MQFQLGVGEWQLRSTLSVNALYIHKIRLKHSLWVKIKEYGDCAKLLTTCVTDHFISFLDSVAYVIIIWQFSSRMFCFWKKINGNAGLLCFEVKEDFLERTTKLIPWSIILLEKRIVAQRVKKHYRLLWKPKIHYSIHKSPPSPRLRVTFSNMLVFTVRNCLDLVQPPKLGDHSLSAVRDCLFNIFAATLHM
jgi:hypothetical protein